MGARKPNTPRSQVRNALRQLWLRSRERQSALKRDRYSCRICGSKQSRAKGREVFVEVDHLAGIDWEELLDLVYDRLLVPPELLRTLCKAHHEEKTGNAKKVDR
jgi:hypothetical protein